VAASASCPKGATRRSGITPGKSSRARGQAVRNSWGSEARKWGSCSLGSHGHVSRSGLFQERACRGEGGGDCLLTHGSGDEEVPKKCLNEAMRLADASWRRGSSERAGEGIVVALSCKRKMKLK
jgi:hypothetical protein